MFTNLISGDGARAQIAHQGGQVISWIPANQSEQLFLSKTSSYESGQAIRGGVPIIFPQFAGFGPLPKHGFARNQLWRLRGADIADRAVFELRDNDATRALWPFSFLAEMEVSVAGDALVMNLSVHNTGDVEFQFTVALHSYFRVDDITRVRIRGLQNCAYQDCVSGDKGCIDSSESIEIQGHIDRLYTDAPNQLEIQQRHQRVVLRHEGFPDAVVWNPWSELGASLSDLEPDGYQRMVCVEAAAIAEPVKLAPGKVWNAKQHLTCYPA